MAAAAQFGLNGPLKQHGIARTTLWRLERSAGAGGTRIGALDHQREPALPSPAGCAAASHTADTTATTAVFVLEDSDATRAEWDHRFRLEYTVRLDARTLRTQLTVINRHDDGGDANATFAFTTALHTYFAIADIAAVRVTGLKGLTYTDKMRNAARVRLVWPRLPPHLLALF